MSSEEYAAVALSRVPAIGAKLYRSLIAHFGSAHRALRASREELMQLPGIAGSTAANFTNDRHHLEAEKILKFCKVHGIRVLHASGEAYPASLTKFDGAPSVLYYWGEISLEESRSLAIVGTRAMTAKGARQVERLIDSLTDYSPLIVSGLAHGVDVAAHRRALHVGLPTLAVLGSGFQHIYPYNNRQTARQMVERGGGLLTEYVPWQKPEREHFPARNRIVAMLSQMTLVVESKASGGSIITANMAHDYGKKVGACPGRGGDVSTAGCNGLIKSGRAHLIEEADDIARLLGWSSRARAAAQVKLFDTLLPEERRLVRALQQQDILSIDELYRQLGDPPAKLAGTLLALEMKGLIASLPGHRYRLAGE